MSRRKEDSYYEEGTGYKINRMPSNANYNTCSVRYALNHDFQKSPTVQYKDSSNAHGRRPHAGMNASTSGQRASGAGCSRPGGSQYTITSSANRPSIKKATPIIFLIIFFVIVILAITVEEIAPFLGIIAVIAIVLLSQNKSKTHR